VEFYVLELGEIVLEHYVLELREIIVASVKMKSGFNNGVVKDITDILLKM
jgi:hypothetical protein